MFKILVLAFVISVIAKVESSCSSGQCEYNGECYDVGVKWRLTEGSFCRFKICATMNMTNDHSLACLNADTDECVYPNATGFPGIIGGVRWENCNCIEKLYNGMFLPNIDCSN